VLFCSSQRSWENTIECVETCPQERWALAADVLLFSSGKRASLLTVCLDALDWVLPSAQRVEFPGLAHSASGNPDDPLTGRAADPQRVALELRRFFA